MKKEIEEVAGELIQTEEVTACFGEQGFCPIAYHSFKVGPFVCKTQVRHDETPEQALARAYDVCVKAARAAYPGARDFHLANAKDAAEAAKGRTRA